MVVSETSVTDKGSAAMNVRCFVLGCGAILLLALAVSTVKMESVRADCFFPQTPDWVQWENNLPYPDETQAEENGDFSSDQKLDWCYTNSPTHGAVEMVVAESDNVENVQYSPAYFFPRTNFGSVVINWSGNLDDPDEDGTLTTLGWCWPPYAEHTKTLTILHY
jgi:hypothetical protein